MSSTPNLDAVRARLAAARSSRVPTPGIMPNVPRTISILPAADGGTTIYHRAPDGKLLKRQSSRVEHRDGLGAFAELR